MQNRSFITLLIVMLVIVGGYYLITVNKKTNKMTTDDTSKMVEETSRTDESQKMDFNEEESAAENKMEKNEESMMENSENVKVFELNGGNFYFKPDAFSVNKGDTVKIVFTNDGGTHDWVIDEFSARTEVTQTGDTGEVTFVADKIGEFEFYCSIGQHRANGMKGTLTVM